MIDMTKAHKILDSWYPGKPKSREELLQDKINRLNQRIAQLEHESYHRSWKDNPDTSGGAFTDWEKEQARYGFSRG